MNNTFRNSHIAILLFFLLTAFFWNANLLAEDLPDSTSLQQMNWDEEEPPEESQDLSKMNWDQEEPETGLTEQELGSMNWDEEETDENATENGLDTVNWDDETSANNNEPWKQEESPTTEVNDAQISSPFQIHLTGSLVFIFYVIGGILTAFATRKSKFIQDTLPEWIMILHTIWPLEWILVSLAPSMKKHN